EHGRASRQADCRTHGDGVALRTSAAREVDVLSPGAVEEVSQVQDAGDDHPDPDGRDEQAAAGPAEYPCRPALLPVAAPDPSGPDDHADGRGGQAEAHDHSPRVAR